MDTIYFVVPCYNEQEVLPETAKRLLQKVKTLVEDGRISSSSRIVFVDDGSRDTTYEIISRLAAEEEMFAGVKLSRNRGHQNALLAGLMTVKDYADAVISLDADLQDDIGAIDQFIEKYKEGCDIVYGVRSARKKDSFFKRTTALAFYRMMKAMGVNIVFNHADYRLMSKRALCALENFREVNLFLRGLVPMVGYKTAEVYYERSERFAGESKYPLKKMLSFAFEGITSLSVKPIRLITATGFIIFVISFLMLLYSFINWLLGNTTQGWSSLMVSIWALGGLQILSIGVIGEYIGKIYLETKGRPRFIIEELLLRK